jgi:hypothetical protein
MSEKNPDESKVDRLLQELRGEFARGADEAGTVDAIAGGPVDIDRPKDLWNFNEDDLENELWNRLLELDQAVLDPAQAIGIRPIVSSPAGHGLSARLKRAYKGLWLRLAWPAIRMSLDKQDRLNRRFKHLQFVQFLAVKRLRQHMQRLEQENHGLRDRLAEMEIERSPGDEPSGHG